MASQVLKKTMEQHALKNPKFQSKKRKAAYTRVTTRLTQESKHYFGEPSPPVFSIVRIFSRPFSEIIQCRIRWPQRSFGLYIKFSLVKENIEGEHKRILNNTEREIEVTRKFFDFFSEEHGVSVPEVIAFFPDDLAVVTKEKEGLPLMKLIVSSARGKPRSRDLDLLKNACYSIGHALTVFQKMPVINTGRDELPSNLISYVDLRLKILSESGFIKTSECLHVLHYLEQQLAKIDEQTLSLCSVHGDLSLGNVLISSEHVVF
ncbi:MAG: phosphotransferase, partial [Nitrospirota bacterium]|nr:phosphotransferase [Nitrospirota bacterium]